MVNQTANFDIPYLDGTELVRDYPTFSEDLANAVDDGLVSARGILQVARATTSVDFTTTSTSYVDSNISISVTPKSASSNLILFWAASFGVFRSDTVTPQISGYARLVDGSDVALAGSEALMYMRFNSGAPRQFIFPKQIVGFVASGSTAARTYKGQVELGGGDRIEVFNNTYQLGQLFAIEVAN